ncbi:PREDICTED: basic leucine zipper 43-like [Tarenaya hassleriana]|uniref:basic leucine zipper 43-like n=1 Tax=Tarenaya hassleriana TaxID=28532 RepID=UPI00053C6AD3|nr:PREDICTED: basic leucine zipper 43-like [Tarenaya hassleriana]
MQPATDVFSLSNYIISSNPSPYPSHFTIPSSFDLNGQIPNPFHGFQTTTAAQSVSFSSNNSTSDEAEEQQINIINERKQRRKISNRESARRSRMRKQRHLDELLSQVMYLMNQNHQLLEKLNHASESHEKVLQENARLKEEATELRQMITDMQIRSPFSCFGDDFRAESP